MNNSVPVRYGQCYDGRIVFIFLYCYNEQVDLAYKSKAYYTTHCVVKRIEDADTRQELDTVQCCGVRNNYVKYEKGQHILGDKTYYCKSIEDLVYLGMCDCDGNGHYYVDGFTHYRRIPFILEGICDLQRKMDKNEHE